MKRTMLFLLLFCGYAIILSAQNVGMGTTTPNASAALEIQASNKGLLIARSICFAIIWPAKGLLVYDTTTASF